MYKIQDLSVNEIKQGYRYENGIYVCQICGTQFCEGEVYQNGSHFYLPEKAIQMHIKEEHESILDVLFEKDSKYVNLTENQKQLMKCMYAGMSDMEVAKKLNVSASTVRTQRFHFREKAKQAKMYLAIYEITQSGFEKKNKENMIDIHEGARMVDERFVITEEEEKDILDKMFISQQPLRLDHIPPKQKKKVIVFKRIAQEFVLDKKYTEKEINEILKAVYEDFVTLRRYLIEYGFLDRSNDGREYWKKK